MSAALSESKKNPGPNPLPEEKSYRFGEVSPRESDAHEGKARGAEHSNESGSLSGRI